MKATKRLLALFLCLVMLFTTVPVEAFATGEDTSGETALNETPNQDNGNGEQAGAEEPAAQSEEATGKIIRAYLNPTKDDGNGRIYVDLGNVHYNESVELKLYSGEALLTTATLNTTEFPAPRTFKELTGSICMVAGKSDTWPNTEWIASEDAVPDKIELVVDGIVVDTIGKIQVKRDGGEMTAEDWIAFPNTLQMHTVTYTDGVDGEEIFADQKYTVEVGKETPAFEGTPARKGYNFIGWSSEVSDTVTGSVTYVAQWKAITYSIMYNAGEGSYVGPALSSGDNWMLIKNGYTYDAPVTLYGGEDFVRPGYTLVGWIVQGETYALGQTIERNFHTVQNGTVQAYAIWQANTYTIKYNAGEGAYVGSEPNSGDDWMLIKNGYTYDAPVTLHSGEGFVRDGYTLVGWIIDDEAYMAGQTVEKNFDTVQGGTVQAYAIWSANTYTIKYNAGEGVYVGTDLNRNDKWLLIKNGYTYDAPVTLYNGDGFVRPGYELLGWIIDEQTYALGQTVEINFTKVQSGTVQAYAVWNANNYTLTLDPNGGKVDPTSITVTYDAAIGELPVPTWAKGSFLGWYDEQGNQVTAETIYTVAGDSTITAKWLPNPDVSYVTNELFTIECTVDHDHSWLCNWFGSHVTFVKGSIKWNEELGRWEAQCKIGSSMLSQINFTQPKKNYFGGIKHFYDETNYVFDLYYDPNFTGLNSAKKEVTGMWLPVQEYVVPVYCYTAPAMPNMSKITSNVIWMREAGNTKNHLKSKLIADTYTVGEMYQENGAFYVNVTVNDLAAYIAAFEAKFGEGYVVGDWTANNTLKDFVFVLKYTGSTTDYKQDGTGWSIDWPNTTEKNNARTLWLTKQYTVTYTDGAEGKVFEDKVFTVYAMTETAKDKFTATATPTIEDPSRVSYIFAGWNPAVAETVTESATYTAQWIQYPGSSSTNVTKELFTIQCTEKHEHSWLCNWFGSHVTFVKDSVKWNAELGRWEAQCKIGSSMLSQINFTQPKKNYFGGIKHFYDETNYVFDLYYDPNFTGLNSQSKEVTGMWLPVQEYVVPVYCYTAPGMPNLSKVSSALLWVRDAGNKNSTHSQKFTVKQLPEGSYTMGQMYTQNGKFYVDVTITDLSAFIAALGEKTGKTYVLPVWEKHYNSADDFSFTLEYTGSTTDYKQDGTGWAVAASTWANNTEKLNGKSLWLTEQYTVTYTDGAEGKVFADQVYTVNAYSENGKTANAVTDFSATATPVFEVPARKGYTHTGWTPEVAATVTGNAAYEAVWTLNVYNITVEANQGGTVEVQETATFNEVVKLAITPNTGYRVVSAKLHYEIDGTPYTANLVDAVRFKMPAADVKIVVEFEQIIYNIEVEFNAGGTVTVQDTAVYGEIVKLAVTPNTGYRVVSAKMHYVSSKGVPVTTELLGADKFKMPAADVKIVVEFEQVIYNITVEAGEHGSVTVQDTAVYAEIVKLAVTPDTGYGVVSAKMHYVSSKGVPVTTELLGADKFKMPAADVTIVVEFAANQYNVTFNSNGGAAIDPITVTFDAAYGKLPTASSVNGFTNPKNSWFLVDEQGNITAVNVRSNTIVSTARDHQLIQKREIFVGAVKVERTPTGAYVGTEYTLTATVANYNGELLNYTYQWYKDGVAIDGATEATLVLPGNYSDNGTYTVTVTATKKDTCSIITWNESASKDGSYTLKLSKIANTLRLNENYGEHPVTSDSYTGGNALSIRSAAVRTGYTFLGWNTAADGSGTMYQKGDSVPFVDTIGNGGIIVELFAQWKANEYVVSYNTNGGAAVADKVVTFDAKYGVMPTSSVTGLSARKTDWYLVDENGNVTDTNIRNTTVVSVARDHTLFLMRDVLAPTLKITLEVPGAISNDYKYYVPGNSTRVLTVTVNNKNEDVLNYSYQWYKDNAPIEGATEAVLTLPGNVSDSGIYKVVVTATLKDGTGIVVKVNSASGEKEQKVQIMRAANTLRLNENHGETPVTSDSYFGGAEFTIRSAAQARTGYTFLGWNTEADGSGTMYQAGDIAEFPGDNGNGGVVLELFAQWKANTYTVTLNANGGTVEPATLTATFGQPIGELPVPVKPGYTFVGWTVAEKNSRAVELVTAETVYDLNADVTLIAVWNVNNYTLTLDANGGKADKDSVAVTYDAVIGELPVPTRTGYTFAGWFDAEGKEITAETVYTVAGDSTATAKWTVNTYKITLDPKGGDLKKGEETVEVTFGEAVGVLPIPSRTGYIFVGWFDAEDKEVTKDTIYELTEDTTLVAKWYVHKPADPSSPPTGDGMTMFVMASMLISAGALLFLLERKRRVQA